MWYNYVLNGMLYNLYIMLMYRVLWFINLNVFLCKKDLCHPKIKKYHPV